MKKTRILLVLFVFLQTLSCTNGANGTGASFDPDSDDIQIVLFHLSQRCSSCNAVEEVTQGVLSALYPDALEEGRIRFISLEFRTREGKAAAEILNASGQTLYVVKGDSVSNLTSEAFMFADTHPERYRKALRETIDKLLE